ncbi:hypothetical protein [Belliella kenyensis]|uniref:hypothetical protein n=1 Tax=Belliella kenyensis TaxID=1472724 RepID=UPI001F4B0451|nr:hypothetical protein [Belliella kenyensis]MCH7401823.1 hypothetical protein [Belliella kenyensis]MDN3604323.1 hypothetical protein [Belliella kenyensis]
MAVLMGLTGGNPTGFGVDGGMAARIANTGSETGSLAGILSKRDSNNDAPPAYLSYLFFDTEMNYKYGGFVQMSQEAREDGTMKSHERLSQEVVADEPGYYYIYPPRRTSSIQRFQYWIGSVL